MLAPEEQLGEISRFCQRDGKDDARFAVIPHTVFQQDAFSSPSAVIWRQGSSREDPVVDPSGAEVMRLQFQTDFAQASLKGLTLVNGGAVVALFTFIGNTAAKFDASRLWWAFGLFIAGLTLTLLATMCGFLAQAFYMQVSFAEAYNFQDTMHGRARSHDPSRETHLGNTFEGAAVVAAFASLISFAVGSGFALAGVLSR